MPTVSALVAHTLSAHIDHVFGVMGNGNALFLDALDRTPTQLHGDASRGRRGRRRRCALPRLGPARRRDRDLRCRLHEHAHRAGRGRAGAHPACVLVVGDEPTTGSRPWDVDQIAMASGVGARTFTVGRTDVAATTVLAIEHALANRTAAVLAIPYDVAGLEVGEADERADDPARALDATAGPRHPRA